MLNGDGSKKFIDLAAAGEASTHDIDDYVAKWHLSGDEVQEDLHEYLGFTWDEYGNWLKDVSSLEEIVEARKTDKQKNL